MILELWKNYKEIILISAGGLLVLLFLILFLIRLIQKNRFRKEFRLAENLPVPNMVVKYTSTVIAMLEKDNSLFMSNPVVGETWLKKLQDTGKLRWLKALMDFGSEIYHFDCFMASLDNQKLMDTYYPYLQGEDDMYRIGKLARSCRGRNFDSIKAKPFLKGSLYSLRDLTGSPDWDTRFFAFNLLIHSDDDKAKRSLWDGMSDPHPRVRILIIEKMSADDPKAFYEKLKTILLDDPYHEARAAARNRIHREFREFYDIEVEKLSDIQKHHIIDQLDGESDKDRDFALKVLSDNDDSLTQSAVIFLNKIGLLREIFEKSDCSDQEGLKRIGQQLLRSLDVGSEDFFNSQKAWKNEGSLLVASRILENKGSLSNVNKLAESVFSRDPKQSDYSWEIYLNTIKLVDSRGSDYAQSLKIKEIEKNRNRWEVMKALLQSIPAEQNYLYRDIFIQVFQDKDIPSRDLLLERLSQFSPALILDNLLGFLIEPSAPLQIKQDSLKILIKMNLPYTLQTILENLPLLSFEDLVATEKDLGRFNQKDFSEKMEFLMKSYDSTVRAALITVLPKKLADKYASDIEDALKDSFADVRIAAAYKLFQVGLLKSSKEHLILLKDPVERVRVSSAKIFADLGSDEAVSELHDILKKDEENQTVKDSVIKALIASNHKGSLEPVMDYMEHNQERLGFIQTSLAERKERSYIERLIEQFRDASPGLRDRLIETFVLMKDNIEDTLAQILTEEVASLQKYLVEIMQQSGFVESLQRKLSHRDPLVRRKSTELLSLVGTKAAFKGIILASKDPDPQVRVNVTRALEKLNTPEGKELLQELEKDPEIRVRRFTQWALERIKVKGRL